MTSSLVGSEMCIRDSILATDPYFDCTCCSKSGIESCARAVARKGNMASVSYTHLTLPTICSV
eukprot:4088266-Prorocentrum_lima.AAC.1